MGGFGAMHYAGRHPELAPLSERSHESLAAAGVAHAFRRFDCGLHVMATAERGLREFWPMMTAT